MIMNQEKFEQRCYELYQLEWMASHEYSLADVFNGLKECAVELAECDDFDTDMNIAFDEIEEMFFERGFGEGSIFVCKDEFLNCEYQDEEYMEYLLDTEMFELYQKYNQ